MNGLYNNDQTFLSVSELLQAVIIAFTWIFIQQSFWWGLGIIYGARDQIWTDFVKGMYSTHCSMSPVDKF